LKGRDLVTFLRESGRGNPRKGGKKGGRFKTDVGSIYEKNVATSQKSSKSRHAMN